MSYDRRTRDRFRTLVTGATGAAGVGALTLTGLLMGLAQRDFAAQQAETSQPEKQQTRQQGDGGQRAERPALRQRPQIRRVTIRYVTPGSTSAVGTGGTVTQQPAAPAPQQQAPQQAPAPAPEPEPAPEPPPAPSSGS